MIIYASTDDRASFDDARSWLKDQGYTKDQVRMFRDNGSLLIEALKDLHKDAK